MRYFCEHTNAYIVTIYILSQYCVPLLTVVQCSNFLAELDALGDDFLADSEDTSYLDAVSAPDPPTGVPQDTTKEKTKTQGGVKLDEFGLPELPN